MTHTPQNIAVFGANGAIGAAFLRQLRQRQPHARLQAIARSGFENVDPAISSHQIDPSDEGALGDAVREMTVHGPLDAVLVATGMLHGPGHMPEKALRDVSAESLHQLFHVNAAVPALILKHTTPFLRRDGACCLRRPFGSRRQHWGQQPGRLVRLPCVGKQLSTC